VGAQSGETPHGGPGHSGVEDIADDRDIQSGNTSSMLADGEQVQQPLRGVLVHAISSINDRAPHPTAGEVRRPRRGVSDHNGLRAQGLEVWTVSTSDSPFWMLL